MTVHMMVKTAKDMYLLNHIGAFVDNVKQNIEKYRQLQQSEDDPLGSQGQCGNGMCGLPGANL